MRPIVNKDKKVFIRSKYARWAVMQGRDDKGELDAYASHLRCPDLSRETEDKHSFPDMKWSWFLDDSEQICYGCGCAVPEYIQAVVRLYLGR